MSLSTLAPSTPIVSLFTGTTAELQQFIYRTWDAAYANRMSFPVWSQEYLDWQLTDPSRRLAAYSDGKLVGVLLGAPYQFQARIDGGNAVPLLGAHWSWLSVDAGMHGQGIPKMLDAERVDIERELGGELIVSYRFTGSRHSLAERPNSRSPLKRFHQMLSVWACPLHGSRLKRWNLNRMEGWMSCGIVPLLPRKVSANPHLRIRPYVSSDAEQCWQVLQHQQKDAVLAIAWTPPSLHHQLAGCSLTHTLVAEVDGCVRGFINYHILTFQGRTQESVAVVDLVACSELSVLGQRQLVLSALNQMREQDVILALKSRSGDLPRSLLLSTGFIPRVPESHLVLQWTQQPRNIPGHQPLHVLWR